MMGLSPSDLIGAGFFMSANESNSIRGKSPGFSAFFLISGNRAFRLDGDTLRPGLLRFRERTKS